MINDIDEPPKPSGELALQTLAMPKDTNSANDIFGGWLVSQMDLAGAITASRVADGRVATVAIESMSFMIPVQVGNVVSCYTEVMSIGRSSIKMQIEVWIDSLAGNEFKQKVTEGTFIFVAIDESGNTRAIA